MGRPRRLLALDPLETARSVAAASRSYAVLRPRAVDIALHDLKGQYYAIPLHHLLGGFRSGIETSMTISIRDEDETLRQAEELVRKGFRTLKVKLGSDPDGT